MKVAIVYDWIDKWGGVERVLLELHKMYPQAIFYTSYYDSKKAPWAKDLKIKTSFIQNLPKFIRESRIFSLIFYPFAFESFNFSEYDLVISVTSSFAKAVITSPKLKHICYLLTPTRFLWSHEKEYVSNGYWLMVIGYWLLRKGLKRWDRIVAQRPDKVISISQTVADRCLKYYGRKSEVIYPGMDMQYWKNVKSMLNNKTQNSSYFLVVSRLEKYKKVDLVIETFNQLQDNLIIVGEGTEEKKLKKLAGNNIQFISNISDMELAQIYSQAQALIMPQEEDFGLVVLEAQFFGCPVIAYTKGGATETIIEGKTGLFFKNQTRESLRDALERFKKISYNLKSSTVSYGKINAEKFSLVEFKKKFKIEF